MGLSATFLALGTRHVIASVVPVPDAETAPLMVALHQLLATGQPVTPALAQAQRNLDHSHSRAMAAAAGFVSIGTGALLQPPEQAGHAGELYIRPDNNRRPWSTR